MAENKNLIRSKQKFGIISQNIMRNPYITVTAKALYAYLAGFAGAENSAFPGRELICHEMGLNKDTFSKYMWELQCWQIITVEKCRSEKGNFENNLYILDHYPETVMLNQKELWLELQKQIKSKNKKSSKEPENTGLSPCPKFSDTGKIEQPCPKIPDPVQPDPVQPDPVISDTKNNILKNNILKNNIFNNRRENNSKEKGKKTQENVVVEKSNQINQIFSSRDIQVSSAIIQTLHEYSLNEITKIADALLSKKKQGKIKNPGGLLASHPEVIDAILKDNFYPDTRKTKTKTEEFAIYISPDEIEELRKSGL